jgi:hypothetical protein
MGLATLGLVLLIAVILGRFARALTEQRFGAFLLRLALGVVVGAGILALLCWAYALGCISISVIEAMPLVAAVALFVCFVGKEVRPPRPEGPP